MRSSWLCTLKDQRLLKNELTAHEIESTDILYLLENAVFLFDVDDDVQVLINRAADEIVRLRRGMANARHILYGD